jgi:hypothetical protein
MTEADYSESNLIDSELISLSDVDSSILFVGVALARKPPKRQEHINQPNSAATPPRVTILPAKPRLTGDRRPIAKYLIKIMLTKWQRKIYVLDPAPEIRP